MKTWFLPPGVPEPKSRPGPEGLRLPEFEPAEIRLLAQRLKAAQRELLKLRNDALFRAIDEAVSEWTAPDGEARRTAEMSFRQASGLAPATAPFSTVLETCAGPNFREWAKSEVIPLAALEKFTPGFDGIPTRAVGPSLVLHVLPGNVPLVWLPSFLACLFMRSPCLLKPAREDPLSASLFCRTIADKLPVLAPALAAVSWTGGDNTLETELLREAEALIIYGGDEAVLSLATRLAPETKLAAHGPRIAVGAITRETSGPGRLEAIAGAAARDGLLYDGRGCLSLSTIYIEEGGIYSPRESARILAQALADASAVLPAGRPDPESAALIQSWRGRLKARALSGNPGLVMAGSRGLDWTLLYDEELPPPPAVLNRTFWICPVKDIEEIAVLLAGQRGRLHALAFAGPEARRVKLAEMLMPMGLTRLTSFGSLQNPPLTWPHGGTSPFKRFLSWTHLER